MIRSLIAALGFGATALVACSSTNVITHVSADAGPASSDAPADEADGSATSTTGSTEPADAAPAAPLACKHALTSAFVRIDNAPGSERPTATGGSVLDGHYVLESAIVYSSGDFPDLSAELWIQGGRYDWQNRNSDQWSFSNGGTITYSGTHMVMKEDCSPGKDTPSWEYSAQGSNLTVMFTNINGFTWVYGLTRAN